MMKECDENKGLETHVDKFEKNVEKRKSLVEKICMGRYTSGKDEMTEEEKTNKNKKIKKKLDEDLRTLIFQDLTAVSYGMSGLSSSGTTIASPDSSLKPDLRYLTPSSPRRIE